MSVEVQKLQKEIEKLKSEVSFHKAVAKRTLEDLAHHTQDQKGDKKQGSNKIKAVLQERVLTLEDVLSQTVAALKKDSQVTGHFYGEWHAAKVYEEPRVRVLWEDGSASSLRLDEVRPGGQIGVLSEDFSPPPPTSDPVDSISSSTRASDQSDEKMPDPTSEGFTSHGRDVAANTCDDDDEDVPPPPPPEENGEEEQKDVLPPPQAQAKSWASLAAVQPTVAPKAKSSATELSSQRATAPLHLMAGSTERSAYERKPLLSPEMAMRLREFKRFHGLDEKCCAALDRLHEPELEKLLRNQLGDNVKDKSALMNKRINDLVNQERPPWKAAEFDAYDRATGLLAKLDRQAKQEVQATRKNNPKALEMFMNCTTFRGVTNYSSYTTSRLNDCVRDAARK